MADAPKVVLCPHPRGPPVVDIRHLLHEIILVEELNV